jgi:hypothetical protein
MKVAYSLRLGSSAASALRANTNPDWQGLYSRHDVVLPIFNIYSHGVDARDLAQATYVLVQGREHIIPGNSRLENEPLL